MGHHTRRDERAVLTAPIPAERHVSSLELSKARQKKELTLEQIANITKISLMFLRAIEAEQFERLPGGIFSTSYLRQYARCIGYDEALLLARFNAIMNPEPEIVAATPSPSQPASIGLRQLFRWLRIPLPAQLTR